jgi:hypothetical protein
MTKVHTKLLIAGGGLMIFSPLFLKRAEIPHDCPRWPTTWSRTRVQEFSEFGEERGGEVSFFQRLAKALIGAGSKNLNMRRLPPSI